QHESLHFHISHIHLIHAVKYLVPPPCHFYAEASPNVAKPQSYYSHPQTTIPFSLQDPPLLQIMFLPFYQLFTLVSDNIPFLRKYDQESANNFLSYTFCKLLSHKIFYLIPFANYYHINEYSILIME